MHTEHERIALLEEQVAALRAASSATGRHATGRPRSRTRRGLAVVGLVVALAVLPAIALANHSFSDVPNSNPFHADISALVGSGVTSGCGGGKYCPKDNVTREQMAAFLNRLGALAPGKTPVVNADRLDGRHANELSRADAAQSSGSTVIPVFTEVQHGSDLVVTAPTSGFVLVTASVMVTESNCTQWCYAHMRVAHVQTGATTVSLETGRFSGDWEFDTLTVSYAFPVSAGTNTFRMLFDRNDDSDADGTVSAAAYTATALFTPFGSSGGSTLDD